MCISYTWESTIPGKYFHKTWSKHGNVIFPSLYSRESFLITWNKCLSRFRFWRVIWSESFTALVVILTCLFFSQICYFFYKNITFGFTLFLYEVYASFSGQPAYNDWFLSLYSVFFSSLPVIALGVLDQDVSARYCLKVSCGLSSKNMFVSNSQALQMVIFKQEKISPSFLGSNSVIVWWQQI